MNLSKLCLVTALCLSASACPNVAFEPDPSATSSDGGTKADSASLSDGGGTKVDSATPPVVGNQTIISIQNPGSAIVYISAPYGSFQPKFERFEAGQFAPFPNPVAPHCEQLQGLSDTRSDNMAIGIGPGGYLDPKCAIKGVMDPGTYRVSVLVYKDETDLGLFRNGREISTTFTVTTGGQIVRLAVGACNDAGLMARWSACRAASNEAECTAVFGTWVNNGTRGVCECQAGDQGCPCTTQADCAAKCWDPASTDNASCAVASRGVCSANNYPSSCFCSLTTADVRQYLCVDPAL